MMQNLLLPALLVVGALSQSTTYLDSNTGITFQSYVDSSHSVSYGIALPADDSEDVIGQIVGPADAAYAGISLGPTMANNLLVVAWPYEGEIIASLRMATGYASPPEYTGSGTLSTIEDGTFINSTHFSYTYLCTSCAADSSSLSSGISAFSWAMSTTALADPSTSSATLTYHAAGFNIFGLDIAAAKSDSFATWAAMASAPDSTTPITPGTNSTTPGTNTTLPVTTSNSTYDYIIAGAGPAGIIVAQRLAESGADVLLIERGPASTYASGGEKLVAWNDTTTIYDVPALGYYLSSMDPDFCTDTASGAGCLLGGGTMVNAMMFVYPQEVDFDDKWPSGWKWTDVASAAERLYARLPGSSLPSEDGIRYDQGAYDVLSPFFAGMGWTLTDLAENPNSKHSVFAHPHWSIENGRRASPATTYLPLAQNLPNFELLLETKVIRAVRNSSYISGIEVETSAGERQIINVNAGGKVILASGALSTPRILWSSGIGRSEQIEIVQNGDIPITLPDESTWIDLPVGEGIQDHPIVTVKFETGNLSTLASTAFTTPSVDNADLFAEGDGLLVQSGQRINFFTSVTASDGSVRYVQGTCNSPANNTVQMKVYLTHGLTSSGDLTINAAGSTEFAVQPWLNTDMDREALSTFIDGIIEQSRAANSTLTFSSASGANATGESLLDTFTSGSHFVGSARMGADDGTAVVDTDTKVYGTDNLYVVDASMHPDLPTGNTQAMVMVAAEHAAARILGSAGSSVGSSSPALPSHFVNTRPVRSGYVRPSQRNSRTRNFPRAGRRSMLRSALRKF